MSYAHALEAAPVLAAAVKPSLTNPLALVVLLGGLGMGVTMFVAALSFRPERTPPETRPADEPGRPPVRPATDPAAELI